MAQDTRHLERRGHTWYAVLAVPAAARGAIGRARLVQSLKTTSLPEAHKRRDSVLAIFRERIAAATAGPDAAASAALAWKRVLDKLSGHQLLIAQAGLEQEADERRAGGAQPYFSIPSRPDLKPPPVGQPNPAGATLLMDVAAGGATPIAPLLTLWLAEEDIEVRSKRDHQRATRELLAWAPTADLKPTIEAFDRRAAGKYVSHLLTIGLDRKTLSKRLWSLSALWRWLAAKGYTDAANPWLGHTLGKKGRSARDKQRERSFTDSELVRLLTGPATPVMHDMMKLALLSGLRIEELALLRVADIEAAEATMSVMADPKTPAARRVVPIHSAVLPAILARLTGKQPDAFIFHELGPAPRPGHSRSMRAGRDFTTYRRAVGIDDRAEGQRRSLTNFHSFRRTFITKAEQAGIPETTIRSVVGHKRAGITFGTYSSGPSLDQRRACVESVRLPTEVQQR